MDNKLTKSLTDLIDETLQELDELRKSRFAASEIKIEGPGDGIAGKPSDGDLHAKKGENEAAKADDDKDEDDDKEHEEKESKAEEKAEHAKKAEMEKGANDEAEKSDKDEKKDKKDDKKSDDKDDDKDDAKAAFAAMKKSFEDSDSLMKSYVEERVKPLEDKLSTILDLVNKIADQPVAPKGATARTPVTPLLKSGDEGYSEPLSKAQVASKLFELKKSGTKVDSLDITKAEMGQDLQHIAKKYEIS